MAKHLVTLFDSKFLPQGLALYESLELNLSDFTLWVICLDDLCYETLRFLNLRKFKLIKLADVETLELLEVKKTRTVAEYCWTLTPFAPDFVFKTNPQIDEITYIDADVFVLNKNIHRIYEEFKESGKPVLITKHSYSPEYDFSATSGIYCVQFIIFCKDGSTKIRENWQKQCLQWCFARYEDGKFGDQKYLEDWPHKYPADVHVLERESLALGPWNCTRYPYSDGAFWHFHGLRIRKNQETATLYVENNDLYKIPSITLKQVYEKYYSFLNKAINKMSTAVNVFEGQ